MTIGLGRAGFDVVGVDIAPQPNHPGCDLDLFDRHNARRHGISYSFVQSDALAYLDKYGADGFAFVWASPPCQRYSTATIQSGNPEDWPDLIVPVRERLIALGVPYIIENVVGAPLVEPITLCGAMFDLGVIRHRLFETSMGIPQPPHPEHKGSLVTGEYVTVAGGGGVPVWTYKEREKIGLPRYFPDEYSLKNWRRAMGIDWMERDEIVEAIPPAFAEWLGREVLTRLP